MIHKKIILLLLILSSHLALADMDTSNAKEVSEKDLPKPEEASDKHLRNLMPLERLDNNTQKELYEAIIEKPTVKLEGPVNSRIKVHTKELMGSLQCQYHEYITANGSSYYSCTIGGFKGASFYIFYHLIKGKEKLILKNKNGEFFEKKIGPITCRKWIYAKPLPPAEDDDMYLSKNSQEYCVIGLVTGETFEPH